MTPAQIIRLNVKIIRVLNSCDRKTFEELVDEVIDQPKVFRKKYYVWNIVRGRDFYKMLAHYVTQEITRHIQQENPTPDIDRMTKAETIIQMVMDTAKTDAIKRNFIWAIMKQVPLLTVTTIQYASPDKIRNLLKLEHTLVMDQAITPFVNEIAELKATIAEQDERIQAMETMMD